MKLLLDTHVWIWSLIEPARLTSGVRSAFESDDNELWLSPISTWETLLLIERGRISVEGEPQALGSGRPLSRGQSRGLRSDARHRGCPSRGRPGKPDAAQPVEGRP